MVAGAQRLAAEHGVDGFVFGVVGEGVGVGCRRDDSRRNKSEGGN